MKNPTATLFNTFSCATLLSLAALLSSGCAQMSSYLEMATAHIGDDTFPNGSQSTDLVLKCVPSLLIQPVRQIRITICFPSALTYVQISCSSTIP